MKNHWLSRLGNIMILVGATLLLVVGSLSMKSILVAQAASTSQFLASTGELELPLPTISLEPTATQPPPTMTPVPTFPASPTARVGGPGRIPGPQPEATSVELPTAAVKVIKKATQRVFNPLVFFQQPDPSQAVWPVVGSPVVHLAIPSLSIERAVVPISMVPDKRGEMQWDTDSLFANRKRDDLVGQVAVSLNPGEGGNIILVGHNTNVGIDWAGVFYNLASLEPGAEIILSTEDGGEFRYIVQLVKKVPWKRQSDAELLKHQRFLFPTESEQLTLVTCGGVFTTQYNARIYVVAVPAAP